MNAAATTQSSQTGSGYVVPQNSKVAAFEKDVADLVLRKALSFLGYAILADKNIQGHFEGRGSRGNKCF